MDTLYSDLGIHVAICRDTDKFSSFSTTVTIEAMTRILSVFAFSQVLLDDAVNDPLREIPAQMTTGYFQTERLISCLKQSTYIPTTSVS